MQKQRIGVIGASGQIGEIVAHELRQRGVEAVTISRRENSPLSVDSHSHHQLLAYEEAHLRTALAECTAAIATVGLPYRSRVWTKEWPALVNAIVSATGSCQIPLTFLDNLYVYGLAESPIKESHPMAPCSRKGFARLEGANILENAREHGQDVMICRAADFLGPGAETTVLPWSTLERVAARRDRCFRWYGDPRARHSFALPADVASGLITACIDSELRAFPALHLPAIAAFSAEDLSAALSRVRGQRVRPVVLDVKSLAAAGIISPGAREQREMMYQFDSELILDDSIFRSHYPEFPRRNVRNVVSMISRGL